MNEKTFNKFCTFFGLAACSPDRDGAGHRLSPAAQQDILADFGIDVSDEAALAQAFFELQWQAWRQVVDPVLVVTEKTEPFSCEIRVPEECAGRPVQWILTEENGDTHDGDVTPAGMPVTGRGEFNGIKYVAVQLPLTMALPCGYHRLAIATDQGDRPESAADCLVIVTPGTCFVPPGLQGQARIWGVSCRVETLRSGRNWGVGDFSDLKELLFRSAEEGAGALAISPLQSRIQGQSERPFSAQVSSLCFSDFVFLDPEVIVDFSENKAARDFFQDPDFQLRLASLRNQQLVPLAEVRAAKIALGELLWHHFQQNHLEPELERGREFRNFQQAGGEELREYSLFAVLREYLKDRDERWNDDWHGWPKDFQDPHSATVADFTLEHRDRIEFYQYLQWQTELQLAAVGRRSMELGLNVGLIGTLAANLHPGGFETWYRPQLFALKMAGAISLPGGQGRGGCPSLLPAGLKDAAYAPFITALRANMRHAGALCINQATIAGPRCRLPAAQAFSGSVFCRYPVVELLGIIALESRRNRCLVICEYDEALPQDFRRRLEQMFILSYRPGYFATSARGDWLSPGHYPSLSMVAASSNELTPLNGYWLGKDIDLLSATGAAAAPAWREKSIISRAADRARLLVALHRQGLLPEGYDVDPSTVPWLSPVLVRSVHLLLAGSAAKICLLPLQDNPSFQERQGIDEQTLDLPGWERKLPMDIENIREDEQLVNLMRSFCAERGEGIVRPSALPVDRVAVIPGSFYRLQLNYDFTFRRAAAVVPYLDSLGISHCYTSPYLKARPGSSHGYDIIDHANLNPEIGSREEYEEFVAALDRHGMAQILDMVPNHMGVGSDNKWWLDVLENGRASQYADFFDINWEPQQQGLKGRVLLPVLGDYYGAVLEGSELHLDFSLEKGTFRITYYGHSFPLDPCSYPFILGHDLGRLEARLGSRHQGVHELQNLISSFANLPGREETDPEQVRTRYRNKEVLKKLLARLCREILEIATFIAGNVVLLNGEKGCSESFNLLHNLLNLQAYRLAFWRVASDEINYRRFFDINDLAGVRAENQRVFEETHRFVFDLIATGKVDGLRIDHPDGLYDPRQYCSRLQAAASGEIAASEKILPAELLLKERPLPLYVVVEKILADFEHLPADWLVHGTTGYDFSVVLNGLFVDSTAEKTFTRIYHRFIGHSMDFELLLYNCKKLIIKTAMAGELNVLAGELHRLGQMNRFTRDYTLNHLRETLIEIISCFPVYRTYITGDRISLDDRNYVEWAVSKAKDRQQAEDPAIYDFMRATLLLEIKAGQGNVLQNTARKFVMKLQQYTGPVMAKGLEDTCFYIYNRLLSLNEVGGDPRRFGISPAAFHHANRVRSTYWPHGMLNTSTHDSKRSEDLRARINVLSEMPGEWQKALTRWSSCNRGFRTEVGHGSAPSKNDEYALYQNLVGVWPFGRMDQDSLASFAGRIEQYMFKVIREAKVHTSWINQNRAYEEAMAQFVRRILDEKSAFLEDFLPFQQKIAWFGMLNSLSQLLLKLTSPGIPDTYQGTEIWHFRLVDPDNRRPVDFHQRKEMLAALQRFMSVAPEELAERAGQLLHTMDDGRVKMYVLWKTLAFRRLHSELFERGSYLPLTVKGKKKKYLCAFMRILAEHLVIVVVPRLSARLLGNDETRLPLGPEAWSNTVIMLPDNLPAQSYTNVLTGEEIFPRGPDNNRLPAAELLRSFPVCLLDKTSETGVCHD